MPRFSYDTIWIWLLFTVGDIRLGLLYAALPRERNKKVSLFGGFNSNFSSNSWTVIGGEFTQPDNSIETKANSISVSQSIATYCDYCVPASVLLCIDFRSYSIHKKNLLLMVLATKYWYTFSVGLLHSNVIKVNVNRCQLNRVLFPLLSNLWEAGILGGNYA